MSSTWYIAGKRSMSSNEESAFDLLKTFNDLCDGPLDNAELLEALKLLKDNINLETIFTSAGASAAIRMVPAFNSCIDVIMISITSHIMATGVNRRAINVASAVDLTLTSEGIPDLRNEQSIKRMLSESNILRFIGDADFANETLSCGNIVVEEAVESILRILRDYVPDEHSVALVKSIYSMMDYMVANGLERKDFETYDNEYMYAGDAIDAALGDIGIQYSKDEINRALISSGDVPIADVIRNNFPMSYLELNDHLKKCIIEKLSSTGDVSKYVDMIDNIFAGGIPILTESNVGRYCSSLDLLDVLRDKGNATLFDCANFIAVNGYEHPSLTPLIVKIYSKLESDSDGNRVPPITLIVGMISVLSNRLSFTKAEVSEEEDIIENLIKGMADNDDELIEEMFKRIISM